MSVRGEFRRLLKDLLAALRDAELAPDTERALAPLAERAGDDLSGAAEAALALLPRLDARAFSDPVERQRFEDAFERLEAVCRVILGR
ncbi:MAG: hypothetical protein E6J87_16380 [Deltaproteobacteria bacterium]|nr:MAG: hypothetical protein E6J87_16380 [Deltaproteobacteria bacterium]